MNTAKNLEAEDRLTTSTEPEDLSVITDEHNENTSLLVRAIAEKDYESVIRIYDTLNDANPADHSGYLFKFYYYLKWDEEKGYAFGHDMLKKGCKNAEDVLLKSAIVFCSEMDAGHLKFPDWELAIALCDRVLILAKNDIAMMRANSVKAQIAAAQGNYQEAVRCQTKAIQHLLRLNRQNSEIDLSKESHSERLSTYKRELSN